MDARPAAARAPASPAARHAWGADPEPPSALAQEEARVDGLPVCDVMACVQRALGEAGMQFLHPDQVTVYARGAGMCVSVRARVESEECAVVVAALHRGCPDAFGALARRMWELLKQEADAGSW
jgi:hypothetical protein